MSLLIKNGRFIDPDQNKDGHFDILVKDGIVTEIGENLNMTVDLVIDAKNKWVVPGLIDVHVHLREPGFEHKETIETGSRAAARGGFTTICCMPNTNPPIDNKETVEFIKSQGEKAGIVNVLPIGAITKGQNGVELTHIEEMLEAGICALSEDGKSVMDARLLKESMLQAKRCGLPMLSHCEDITLAGGSMNAGANARRLGIQGIGNDAEDVITARDIVLAKHTGVKLHLCHVSTAFSLELIRFAKSMGIHVTSETAPHYFALTDDIVKAEDANAKMSPPLRTKEDQEAMKKALQDNTIDIIATDHAPHHEDEKNTDFEKAPFGIVGLETSFAISYTELVETGLLTPMALIEKMSTNPAKLMGIDRGSLAKGKVADITIIDPEKSYTIDPDEFVSKSKNTPFTGQEVKGKIIYTIVNGKIVYQEN